MMEVPGKDEMVSRKWPPGSLRTSPTSIWSVTALEARETTQSTFGPSRELTPALAMHSEWRAGKNGNSTRRVRSDSLAGGLTTKITHVRPSLGRARSNSAQRHYYRQHAGLKRKDIAGLERLGIGPIAHPTRVGHLSQMLLNPPHLC